MSFDRLARHYRWMEFVLAGEKLQRCRTAFLNELADARNILTVGEGNGRFLTECRRRLPSARITVVDSSAGMLRFARARLAASDAGTDNVEFIHTNLLEWRPPGAVYDLIVTHFFLDCFPRGQLEQVVEILAGAATPGAAWLLADFQIPERGWQRCRASAIHAMMYSFFGAVTRIPARAMVSPDGFLEANRFVLRDRQIHDWGLLHTDLWTRRTGQISA